MFRKFIAYVLLLFQGLMIIQAQENLNILLYKGNKDFDRKNYDKATSRFMDAVKTKDNDFGAHYNLANALYKKKMFSQANAEYQKAQKTTQDPKEKAAAFYNMGNAYLQNGQLEKAVAAYKNALKNNPDDAAILKNLQIAKKKQDQQQNKGKSQRQNQNNTPKQQEVKSNSADKNAEESPENKNQNTKSQDQGTTGSENKGKGTEGKLPNQQNNNQNQQNNNTIPKDLQQLILQRSANQERETARSLQNKKAYSVPESNEKDW